MAGWISIDRKIMSWEWYCDSCMVHLWLHLLLSASHEETKKRGITIQRGQLITSVREIAEQTGLTPKQIRARLKKLEMGEQIIVKGANKFSTITICKYDSYQNNICTDGQTKGKQMGNQRANTYNNKDNNIINNILTPRVYTCEEAKQSLSVASLWAEQICMKCGLRPLDYPARVNAFLEEMECRCKVWESESDMRGHFYNWLKEEPKHQQQAKPKTNTGISDAERERIRKSEELHRQHMENARKAKPMPDAIAKRWGNRN